MKGDFHMYKDYKSINGETLVSDEKGMHQIETTDKIGEELTLENEIEILENIIANLNKEQNNIGTHKSIKEAREKIIVMIIGIICGTLLAAGLNHFSVMAKWEVSIPFLPFIHTHEMLCALFSLIIGTSLSSLIGGIFFSECNKKENRLYEIENELEYLYSELNAKKEELEELRKTSKKESITDTTIHSIDNSKYRAELKERLNLLSYIRQYKDILRKHLENGTLIEELRGLEIKPEDISFAETALKRVLEKEKSY